MSLDIVEENDNYIVIHKPAGVPTQTSQPGQKDLVSEVNNYLFSKGNKCPRISVINRLDQPVEGLVLFAKNSKAAAVLTGCLNDNGIEKYYEAVVFGHLSEKSGRLENMLVKDSKTNTSRIAEPGEKQAKRAILEYEVIESDDLTDKVRIHLLTGRHHQIRVQFSHIGHPLLGDLKYGNDESIGLSKERNVKNVSLLAYKLSFFDTFKGKEVSFTL